MARTPKLVEIVWSDILDGGPEWHHDEGEPLRPVRVRTVGYVIRETQKTLEIARDYYHHEGKRTLGGRLVIPKGCIEKLTVLGAKE